jgi:hypothetical protein
MMANEITITNGIRIEKGNLRVQRDVLTTNRDLTGGRVQFSVQNIAVTATNIDTGDLTTAGWAMFRNLNATHFVDVGPLDGSNNLVSFIRLRPGDRHGPVRLQSLTLAAIANTASVDLEVLIAED